MADQTETASQNPMTLWRRAAYAFFSSVVVIGVGTVAEMLLAAGSSPVRIGDMVYSPFFFVPVFVIAYLLAPRLARRLHFE